MAAPYVPGTIDAYKYASPSHGSPRLLAPLEEIVERILATT